MRIIGANGILTHGEKNVDLLLSQLALLGHEVIDVRLPKRSWISARWGGKKDGQEIAFNSRDGDIIVAHSFGCLRAWYAHNWRDYKAIICIAPAMPWKSIWHRPERVHCFHSPDDWAIRAGALLRFHPFGRAGNRGFKQKGIKNVECKGFGHNDYFEGAALTKMARYINDLAGFENMN